MKRYGYILLLMVVLLMGVSACERAAATAPVVPTADNVPFPTPVSNDTMKNIQALTATAAALPSGVQPTAAVVEPQATPVVEVQPTAAPQPEPTAVPQPEPTQAPVVVVTTAPVRPTTYSLQKGEHPYCIARRYNIDVDALLNLNGISRTQSNFAEGFTLKIPGTGNYVGERRLKAHPVSYTVVAGDTVNKIACAFGDVMPEDIIAANSLQSPYTLTAGQTLNIP
ncbi:MAG TPA: LysM peptidoglycan-binding domain-containing protein [Anaerolineaceae bacterium]|nr:LysM peptidoglycan-binding domain-containing protein [Anaerolineaceae bacterium]HPN52100.1 LysM peptidoglycan-binding domain-containing protein [Anaerolineaceae bacterium]